MLLGKIQTILFMLLCLQITTFKEQQLQFSRVKQAYKSKEVNMLYLLKDKKIKTDELQLYIRVFKSEKLIELWGKNLTDTEYKLITTYNVCKLSGVLGPKRKRGDFQVPEGFYHIDRFNPKSNFHLSLGINYPNTSDRILGNKTNYGGDIFIHGNCVTIGCLPLEMQIEELYIFCVEAQNNNPSNIPVNIFPTKLTEKNFKVLSALYKDEKDKIKLWTDLKKGYDIFNKTKKLPRIQFLANGRHQVKK